MSIGDNDEDLTVYSPSLENETPEGQAPGGPIESDDIPEPDYNDLADTVVV